MNSLQGGELLQSRRRAALCLLSGGLDSQLAVHVLRDQAVPVRGVAFESPFFDTAAARRAAARLSLDLRIVDFTADIVGLLKGARHGFGSCMNPCIDCHARMLRRAGDLLAEVGCDFLATGEVLNERPFSQTRQSLDVVARDSGYADLVLRPLSAQLLPPTRPEREGWVDRARLLRFEGRGRVGQMRLAEHYGFADYPTPAGGCRLTEPNFCARLRDLREHEGIEGARSLILLRYGRHFRLGPRTKLIVGRNEADNAFLEGTAELYDLVLRVEEAPGPTSVLPYTASEADTGLAASICARYSDARNAAEVTVRLRSSRGIRRLRVRPCAADDAERLRV